MKKLLFIFAVLAQVVCAQVPQTQVVFESYSHDFGTIAEEDGLVSCTFAFKNTGDNKLVINTISVTCGCTTPKWSKVPVEAGASGSIVVSYDPLNRPGYFEKQIFVNANVGGGSVKLTISGTVQPRPRTVAEDFPHEIAYGIRVASRVINLGNVPINKSANGSISAVNTSAVSVKMAVDGTVETIESGARKEFAVKLGDEKNYGTKERYADVEINGKRTDSQIVITGVVVDDFVKSDSRPAASYSSYFYHFSDQPIGAKLEREFTVTNSGTADLEIRKLEFNAKKLDVKIAGKAIKPGQSQVIKVTLKATDKQGKVAENVRVIPNDPEQPVRDIRVMATIK